jgi:hypothetical protein
MRFPNVVGERATHGVILNEFHCASVWQGCLTAPDGLVGQKCVVRGPFVVDDWVRLPWYRAAVARLGGGRQKCEFERGVMWDASIRCCALMVVVLVDGLMTIFDHCGGRFAR